MLDMSPERHEVGVSAPLWPVVLPSVTGLILAFIPYIFQTDYFTTRNLLTPVIILALVGLLVFLLNEKYGNKNELYLGYVLGLIVFYSFRFLRILWYCSCNSNLVRAIYVHLAI